MSQTKGLLKTSPANTSSRVSVNASVTFEVSNATLKNKIDILRSAISGFFNSAQNVLKTSETDQIGVKTKIINLVSNDTQYVEGSEATNAIIGVEINKALRSMVSSTERLQHGSIITVFTQSSCNPSILCENLVTIK